MTTGGSWITYGKLARCPYCGTAHSCATHAAGGDSEDDDGTPKDGTLSVCVECGHIGIFESSAPGAIRRTTAKEAAAFSVDPQIASVMLAWRMTDQQRKARRLLGVPPFPKKPTL